MNPKPTASPTPALAQSPAAVVSPTTRLLMVTIIVPTPRKPMPLITWAGAHTGDVDIGAWELIKGEFIDNHGQRGAHTDQGMGLNPCLLIFASLSRPMIAPASVAIMRRAITEGMLHK